MPESTDHPRVVIFPPLLFGGTLLLGLGLDRLLSLGGLAGLPSLPLRITGGALVLLGLAVALWGSATLKRAGTNVNPGEPTLAIVSGGPYRYSRNPLYLILLLPVLAVAHYGIVLREEAYLEAKFGETYRTYKASVRRWI